MSTATIFIAAMSFSIAPRIANDSTGVVDGVSNRHTNRFMLQFVYRR